MIWLQLHHIGRRMRKEITLLWCYSISIFSIVSYLSFVLCVQSLSLWINYRKLFPAKWYEKYLSPVYPAFGLLRHLFAWVRLLCLCHAVVVLSIGMEEMSSWLPAQAMKRFGFSGTGPLPPSRSCVCHGRKPVTVIPLKGEAERSLCLPLALCLPGLLGW